jgi:hypothetical protein
MDKHYWAELRKVNVICNAPLNEALIGAMLAVASDFVDIDARYWCSHARFNKLPFGPLAL